MLKGRKIELQQQEIITIRHLYAKCLRPIHLGLQWNECPKTYVKGSSHAPDFTIIDELLV